MNALARAAAQVLLYAAFLGAVGYFATAPRFHQLAPDTALVRLTVSHAAEREVPCRKRTPEELAKLAPNMRAPLDCPRARAPVTVEIALDDAPVERVVAHPTGLARDGPSTIYRRIEIPAGTHRIRARLADNAQGRFDHVASQTIELAAGRVLTIDFNAAAGDFVFIQ